MSSKISAAQTLKQVADLENILKELTTQLQNKKNILILNNLMTEKNVRIEDIIKDFAVIEKKEKK